MNQKLNKLSIFIWVIKIIILLYALFFSIVNYYIMPRLIVPAVKEFIAVNLSADVKLSVEKIGFSPLKGFLLKTVTLTGPVGIENGLVLKSKLVDIDLDWLAILDKKIKINRLNVINAKLNISRDLSGTWNFQPVFDTNFINQSNDFKVILDRLMIKDANIDYCDTFDKNNSLKKNLNHVNLSIDNIGNDSYKIALSSYSDSVNKEKIWASFIYDKPKVSLIGSAHINAFYLGEYWSYYLDDIFKPWVFDAESINANIDFSFIGDVLLLKGRYEIEKGKITFGDFSIKANAILSRGARFDFGKPAENSVDINLKLKDALVSSGDNILIRNCEGDVEISSKEIGFKKLNGLLFGQKFDLKGRYAFNEAKELDLNGNIGKGQAQVILKVLENNQGSLEARYNLINSFLSLKSDFSDLKNQVFNLKIDGIFDLNDLFGSKEREIEPGASDVSAVVSTLGYKPAENFPPQFKGRLKVEANISGELDKVDSFNGDALINADGLSLFGINFGSLNVYSIIKGGVLSADIPKFDFYQGNLCAIFKAGLKGSAVQITLSDLNIEDFLKGRPYFSGFKGILGGNIVYCIRANNFKDFFGGGYLKLTNSGLKNLAMFSAAEDGIKSVKKDFKMPNFKIVEGNFSFDVKKINADNFNCKSDTIDLSIIGKFKYTGQAEFNLGVRLFGQNFLRIARQIIIPYTIGFDVLTDSVYINLAGKWPNLKQKTKVQPMRLLNSFFKLDTAIKPDKYSLDTFWGKF